MLIDVESFGCDGWEGVGEVGVDFFYVVVFDEEGVEFVVWVGDEVVEGDGGVVYEFLYDFLIIIVVVVDCIIVVVIVLVLFYG